MLILAKEWGSHVSGLVLQKYCQCWTCPTLTFTLADQTGGSWAQKTPISWIFPCSEEWTDNMNISNHNVTVPKYTDIWFRTFMFSSSRHKLLYWILSFLHLLIPSWVPEMLDNSFLGLKRNIVFLSDLSLHLKIPYLASWVLQFRAWSFPLGCVLKHLWKGKNLANASSSYFLTVSVCTQEIFLLGGKGKGIV